MTKKTSPPAPETLVKDVKSNLEKEVSMPVNLLLSFALATTCTAVAVKVLKKSELALLAGLMLSPVALLCLKNKGKLHCCPKY